MRTVFKEYMIFGYLVLSLIYLCAGMWYFDMMLYTLSILFFLSAGILINVFAFIKINKRLDEIDKLVKETKKIAKEWYE